MNLQSSKNHYYQPKIILKFYFTKLIGLLLNWSSYITICTAEESRPGLPGVCSFYAKTQGSDMVLCPTLAKPVTW